LARLMVDADIEARKYAGRPWIDAVRCDSWNSPAVSKDATR